MNLPNKLTVARIIMAPLFLVALLLEFPGHFFVALGLFALASITDLLDGKIARKYNLITDFGKFLDPLADKMLTTAALVGFIQIDAVRPYGMVWITYLVLLREFLMASLRLTAVSNGKVIAANLWGKVKTVCQMIGILLTILWLGIADVFQQSAWLLCSLKALAIATLWLSALFTVISCVIYIKDNWKFMNPNL